MLRRSDSNGVVMADTDQAYPSHGSTLTSDTQHLQHWSWQRARPWRSGSRIAGIVVVAALANVGLVLALALLAQRPPVNAPPPMIRPPVKELSIVPPPPPTTSQQQVAPSPPMPTVLVAQPEIALPPIELPLSAPTQPTMAQMVHEPIPEAISEPVPVPAVAATAVAKQAPVVVEPSTVAAGPRRELLPPLAKYYPRRAINRRLNGQTVVRVLVQADGSVSDVEILTSTPPGVFDSAAMKAARRIRYGARPGNAAAVWVEEKLEWKIGR